MENAADVVVAEVGQDSSEHVSELEEQAVVHEDPEYTHFASDENMWRKSVALDTFQPPMLRLNVAPAEENIEKKLATEATFQRPISWLNAGAFSNIPAHTCGLQLQVCTNVHAVSRWQQPVDTE